MRSKVDSLTARSRDSIFDSRSANARSWVLAAASRVEIRTERPSRSCVNESRSLVRYSTFSRRADVSAAGVMSIIGECAVVYESVEDVARDCEEVVARASAESAFCLNSSFSYSNASKRDWSLAISSVNSSCCLIQSFTVELAAEPGRGEAGPAEFELIVRCIRAACKLWKDAEGGSPSSSSPEPIFADEGEVGGGIATELGILGLGVFNDSFAFEVGEPVIVASS